MTELGIAQTSTLLGIVKNFDGEVHATAVLDFFASFLGELEALTELGLLTRRKSDEGLAIWTITDEGRQALRDSESLLKLEELAQLAKKD